MVARRALVTGLVFVFGCSHPRAAPPSADDTLGEGGVRIRMVAEVPPVGDTAQGRELDLPLQWMYLIADPVATGSAPNVAVGAAVPCGYEPYYAASARHYGEVTVRIRARRVPADAMEAGCVAPRITVHLVSLGVLRVGDWNVVDAVPRGRGEPPAPTVTVHVVPDDPAHLPPALATWTRPCAADRDCVGGGVCAHITSAGLCLAPVDPWLPQGLPCPLGTIPTTVTQGPGLSGTRQACVGSCDASHSCPPRYGCGDAGVCLPAAILPRAGVRAEGGGAQRTDAGVLQQHGWIVTPSAHA